MSEAAVYARRAAAHGALFSEHLGLPVPCSAEIRGDGLIGIRLHYPALEGVVGWSVRFTTAVKFEERRTFVRVSAVSAASGEPVMAWTQLTHLEAFQLLRRFGFELGPKVIEIPALLASGLSTVSAA